jgi:glycosyltransferase EpsF
MGGAETWLLEVLRLWSRNRAGTMEFVCTSGKVGIFDEEARALGATIHYLPFGRSHLPRFIRELRRILKAGRYQAIHDHQDFVSGWHFLFGGGALPAVRVTHVHNPSYQIRNNYGVTRARRAATAIGARLVARYATHITGTSRQIITEFGFDSPRFQDLPKSAVYCGIDPARFLGETDAARISVRREFGWPDDSKIVLSVGRIDQSAELWHAQNHKNSGFVVSVGIESARRDPNIRVLLAGKGSPAVKVLCERIAAAGLSDRVRFAGIRRDIERLMLASDILLFPSRGEGLGMATVEAQAAGLPVLASTAVPRECVVVPDLVHFCDLEGGAGRWAEELLRVAGSPGDRQAANRLVAESRFAITNSAAALLQLYRGTPLT